MLLNNGFTSERCGKLNFLELVIKLELYLKEILEEEANKSSNLNKMMLFDKCPIDNLAFIERKQLDDILKRLNTSYDKIITSYDLIFHLETVAKYYPELYTNETNKNRTLNKDLAIERNDRLLKAYDGIDKRIIISSTKNIKDKQEKVIKEIEVYERKIKNA